MRWKRFGHGLGAILLLGAFLFPAPSPGDTRKARKLALLYSDLTQDDVDFRKDTYANKAGDRLPYRLFVPLGYDKNGKYPLILWLHGNDGRGVDNKKQLEKDNQLASHFWISKSVQNSFPVFVLVPQCPVGKNWAEPEANQPTVYLQLAMEVLAKIQKQFPVDPDRVYVGGQAMGGLGVWSLLQKYPGVWAGALIISAYDNFTDVSNIAPVPVWLFQGDVGDSVPVTVVRDMVRQLKKANANIRYTEYRKVTHDVWKEAFGEPDLVSWLSAQRRSMKAGGQVGSGGAAANR
jgi:predicted peptidase